MKIAVIHSGWDNGVEKRMKITVKHLGCDYEVEIRAKRVGNDEGSSEDTMSILNGLACVLWDSYNYNGSLGLRQLAKTSAENASRVHQFLEEKDYYTED